MPVSEIAVPTATYALHTSWSLNGQRWARHGRSHGDGQLWDTLSAKETLTGIRMGGDSLHGRQIPRLCFLTPFPVAREHLQPSCHRSKMLRADFLSFTRQLIHSSLTRRSITKVTVLQRRIRARILWFPKGLLTPDTECPPALLAQPGHTQPALCKVTCGSFLLDFGGLTEDSYSFSCQSVIQQQQTRLCVITVIVGEEPPLTDVKTLKGSKPYNAGRLQWELRVTGKIQLRAVSRVKKEKRTINQ